MSEESAASIEITRAKPGEEATASAIVQEAERWLAGSGRAMWGPEDWAPDTLRAFAAAGELYLARLNGEPVGTLVLQWEDPVNWPEVTEGDSAFVHRLAVKRAVAGTGVSHALLEYAKRVAQQAGRKYLRLET
jgi:GNAT superfamily N-acetyltransferase